MSGGANLADPADSAVRLLEELAAFVRDTPELREFAPFDAGARADAEPGDASPSGPAPPCVDLLARRTAPELPRAGALISAFADAAPELPWKQTYSESEVGRDFLDRYGYVEVVGPDGVFRSDRTRAFLAYWGSGLDYDWHHHEAEELYYVLAGSAVFEAESLESSPESMRQTAPVAYGGSPGRTAKARALHPGGSCVHVADQPHATRVGPDGLVALVLWRGAGIDGLPIMGRQK